jgi:hypothetical protein
MRTKAILFTVALLSAIGCSSQSSQNVGTSDSTTVQALTAEAEGMFDNPGTLLFTQPASSLPGISTWSVYQTTGDSPGVKVQGSDDGDQVKTELVFVLGDDGGLHAVAYGIAADFDADGETVQTAVATDFGGSAPTAGDLNTSSLRALDDPQAPQSAAPPSAPPSAPPTCASALGSALWAISTKGVALVGIGAGMVGTCPETLGVGCVVGGAAFVTTSIGLVYDGIPAGKAVYAGCFAAQSACSNRSDGLYCGAALGLTDSASTLFECAKGQSSTHAACPNGCSGDATGKDQCTPPPSCDGLSDGVYCGSNSVHGEPNTLYQCTATKISVVSRCANGCTTGGAGAPDACTVSSSCDGLKDGSYCGSNGITNGDPNSLYQCAGGKTVKTSACPNGCTASEAGKDSCG